MESGMDFNETIARNFNKKGKLAVKRVVQIYFPSVFTEGVWPLKMVLMLVSLTLFNSVFKPALNSSFKYES